MSKEDYLPKWLNKHIPAEGKIAEHIIDNVTYKSGKFLVDTPKTGRLQKGEGQIQKTLRVVCQRCNGTWMSSMHTTCKSLILSYIDNGWAVLNKAEVESLSAWITMHAMVREFGTAFQTITPQERREFYQTQTALQNWNIWLGQFSGSTPVLQSSLGSIRAVSGKEKHSGFVGHTSLVFAIIGRLIFHCVGTNRTEAFSFLRGDYSARIGLTPIWLGEARAVGKALPRLTADQYVLLVRKSGAALTKGFTDGFQK